MHTEMFASSLLVRILV